MHSKLSCISNATDRLTAPRNNDVILYQSALLRGHESHQRPSVRVLILDFQPVTWPLELFQFDPVHQQKVGSWFVEAHWRRKSDRLTVQTAFAKQ